MHHYFQQCLVCGKTLLGAEVIIFLSLRDKLNIFLDKVRMPP